MTSNCSPDINSYKFFLQNNKYTCFPLRRTYTNRPGMFPLLRQSANLEHFTQQMFAYLLNLGLNVSALERTLPVLPHLAKPTCYIHSHHICKFSPNHSSSCSPETYLYSSWYIQLIVFTPQILIQKNTLKIFISVIVYALMNPALYCKRYPLP